MPTNVRLFIDVETHYEPKGAYNLKKMTTAQYVRDERFELKGAVLAAPGYIEPGWYDGLDSVRNALADLPWPDVEVVAHNCQFDALVLNERIRPGESTARRYYCTQFGLRYGIAQQYIDPSKRVALDEYIDKGDTAEAVEGDADIADYAMRDLKGLIQLYKQQMHWSVPDMERDLIDLHVRAMAEPVLLTDRTILESQASQEPSDLVKKIRKQNTFVEALRACGVEPETKTSPRTGKPTYAFAKTDSFMQRLANHDDPRARKLHELRTQGGSNINRTRAQRMLSMGNPAPAPLTYFGAHTGRTSGCVVAGTEITVYDHKVGTVLSKNIVDVLPDDLVWDGDHFVMHDGVKFSGYQEVMEYDGIEATPEHVVYTADGAVSLAEAAARGSRIQIAPYPPTNRK